MKYKEPVQIFTITELEIALAADALVEFTANADLSDDADRLCDRIGSGGWARIEDEEDIASLRRILSEPFLVGDMARAHFPA